MPETIGLHLISVTVGRRHLSSENQTLPSFPASTEGRIRHGHPSAKENSAVQKKAAKFIRLHAFHSELVILKNSDSIVKCLKNIYSLNFILSDNEIKIMRRKSINDKYML